MTNAAHLEGNRRGRNERDELTILADFILREYVTPHESLPLRFNCRHCMGEDGETRTEHATTCPVSIACRYRSRPTTPGPNATLPVEAAPATSLEATVGRAGLVQLAKEARILRQQVREASVPA